MSSPVIMSLHQSYQGKFIALILFLKIPLKSIVAEKHMFNHFFHDILLQSPSTCTPCSHSSVCGPTEVLVDKVVFMYMIYLPSAGLFAQHHISWIMHFHTRHTLMSAHNNWWCGQHRSVVLCDSFNVLISAHPKYRTYSSRFVAFCVH